MVFNWFRKKSDYLSCPNCHIQWSWDGYKCIHCGYIENAPSDRPELSAKVMSFFAPKTYKPYELYHEKNLIPESPGVYAWYFDNFFTDSFSFSPKKPNVITIELDSANLSDWFLLYIGIAGVKEGRTLRDRIYGDHLNQNSKGSTFRQSLAALLWQKIGLDPIKQLNGENERQKLNGWIFQHARIAWAETNKPEIIEKMMLREFGNLLRLNIKDNKKNPYIKELKQLRKKWRKAGK